LHRYEQLMADSAVLQTFRHLEVDAGFSANPVDVVDVLGHKVNADITSVYTADSAADLDDRRNELAARIVQSPERRRRWSRRTSHSNGRRHVAHNVEFAWI
jgi:hypothetical protein